MKSASWDDYELNGTPCPACGYAITRCRPCSNFCANGYLHESDDPMLLYPEEAETPCPSCRGTSIEVWCPCCGANVSGRKIRESKFVYK